MLRILKAQVYTQPRVDDGGKGEWKIGDLHPDGGLGDPDRIPEQNPGDEERGAEKVEEEAGEIFQERQHRSS